MPTVPVQGTLPRLRTQLDTGSPTASDDCAAVTALNLIRWASHGRVGPDGQHEVAAWVKRFRVAAGGGSAMTGGMFIRAEVLKALRSSWLRGEFQKHGLKPLLTDYYFRIDWEDLKKIGQKGHGILLPLDYGTLIRGKAPIGDPNFYGDHSVGLIGFRTVSNRVYTNDGDPLFDGRRHGIPDGYQDTRWHYFKDAAGDFAVNGKATAIIVKRAALA